MGGFGLFSGKGKEAPKEDFSISEKGKVHDPILDGPRKPASAGFEGVSLGGSIDDEDDGDEDAWEADIPSRVSLGGSSPKSTEKLSESERVFHNLRFTLSDGKYVAKGLASKIIILDRSHQTPAVIEAIKSGLTFSAKLIRDTDTFNPHRGAFIVEPVGIPDSGVKVGAVREKTTTEPIKTPEKISYNDAVEVDFENGIVHVLDTTIPIKEGVDVDSLKSQIERVQAKYTLDKRTAETIRTIAEAVDLDKACLLEGETAVSKTSAIEYLAKVSGNEVVRLNLNGQSDTSDLIGKFVPNDEGAQYSSEQLISGRDSFSQDSQSIIDRIKEEGRGLTRVEIDKIAANENLAKSEWRWQHGLVIKAMIEGRWLILDEMNLAEPQILERLNSLLENPRSMTLAENGGLVVKELSEEEKEQYEKGQLSGVAPLHPNFRIFGTMNPAEYQGRSVMSPAYKNRWPVYHNVENPTARDYEQMLQHMVYGNQPEFSSDGAKYGGGKNETIFERLSSAKSLFVDYIPKLAQFHSRVEEMAKKREIGKDRREPYIFTRRDLLSLVD